jgi:hypothetical protein
MNRREILSEGGAVLRNELSLCPSAGQIGIARKYQCPAKNEFGPEYFPFWLIYFGQVPRVCPKCHSDSIKILNLGLPGDSVTGMMWCKR